MAGWEIEATDGFKRAYKAYEKKHPLELAAILDNLDAYLNVLQGGVNSQFVVAGYIHHEPKGVKALDQKGKHRGKLKQTRLYVYPDEVVKKVYLITIGDKHSQTEDIKLCSGFVADLKETKNG